MLKKEDWYKKTNGLKRRLLGKTDGPKRKMLQKYDSSKKKQKRQML